MVKLRQLEDLHSSSGVQLPLEVHAARIVEEGAELVGRDAALHDAHGVGGRDSAVEPRMGDDRDLVAVHFSKALSPSLCLAALHAPILCLAFVR
jgi:hypothetical protein